MKRTLKTAVTVALILSLAGCSEQREKIADLFRWGEVEPVHEIKKADPRAAEDLDMGGMTVESLKKAGVKVVEISPEAIHLSAEKQQISGIRFGKVEVRLLEKVIRTVGRLEYDEKKIATVNPKVGGWIEDLYVDYTGKMVRKGQPLLSIYSPDLVSAQEEFLLALRVKRTLTGSQASTSVLSGRCRRKLSATCSSRPCRSASIRSSMSRCRFLKSLSVSRAPTLISLVRIPSR